MITSETTMMSVHTTKVAEGANLLHDYLCKNGMGLCCVANLTIGEAARLSGKDAELLVEELNKIPNK